MLESVTPVLLAYNGPANIGRVLERPTSARDILVIDGFSADSTLDIVRRHPQPAASPATALRLRAP